MQISFDILHGERGKTVKVYSYMMIIFVWLLLGSKKNLKGEHRFSLEPHITEKREQAHDVTTNFHLIYSMKVLKYNFNSMPG